MAMAEARGAPRCIGDKMMNEWYSKLVNLVYVRFVRFALLPWNDTSHWHWPRFWLETCIFSVEITRQPGRLSPLRKRTTLWNFFPEFEDLVTHSETFKG